MSEIGALEIEPEIGAVLLKPIAELSWAVSGVRVPKAIQECTNCMPEG